MVDKLHKEETLTEKLKAIEIWLGTPEALEHIYKSSNFTNEFLLLALYTLSTIKPEKQATNTQRTLIYKILYRIKIKDFIHYKKLIELIIETIKYDCLTNVSLAIKCLIILVKKNKLEEVQIFELVNSFTFVIEDVMNSFRTGNEELIGHSLNVFSELLPFLTLILKIYTAQVDKFEKVTRDIFSFSMLFMNSNEFNNLIINSEVIMMELINTLFKAVKYFVDLFTTTGKDFTTKSTTPEICMFIMNFCPDSAENLKMDIYKQISAYIIKHRDLFSAYIDIIISDNILLKPGPMNMRINGCLFSTEIAMYYKDKINKETLVVLVQTICSLIEIEFKSHDGSSSEEKEKNPVFYFKPESVESLKILVNSLIKVTDVILHQKFTYYEKHTMYMKVFYEISKIFCGITSFIESSSDASKTDAKMLIRICIRGLKNLMNHFGTIKENVQSLIHSLKCFSQEEIAKFSRIFNYSLRLFSTEMFSTDDIQLFEELYLIFIYLEEQNFYAIISTNLNFLIAQTEKKKILFIVWRFYLGIKTIAPTFFTSMIGFFLSSDTKINDVEFAKEGFDHIFRVLQAFPHEVDHVFSSKVEQVLNFLVVTDEINFYRFEILRSMLKHLENVRTSLPLTFRMITIKLDWILRTLLRLFRYYQENTIFVELLLMIPKQFVFIISKFKLFIDPLIFALETEEQRENGLEFLNICVDNLQSEFIIENSCNKLHTIMSLVLECTKMEELRDLALDVFFNYKGDSLLENFKVPNNNQRYKSKISLKNEQINIKIDSILEKCIEVLRGKLLYMPFDDVIPNKSIISCFKKNSGYLQGDSNQVKASFNFLCAFIYVSIGWGVYDKFDVIKKVKGHFKSISQNGAAIKLRMDKNIINEMTKHSHFIRIHNINIFEIIQAKQCIYDAIIALFSTEDPDINEDVMDFLELVYFTVVIYRVIESFRLSEKNTKLHFDYLSFIDPLLECFGKKTSRKRTEKIILFIYQKLNEICGCKALIRKVLLFNDIIFKLTTFCYFKIDEQRKAGLYGIIFIVKNIDLETLFIQTHRCQIFRALFFYMQNASSTEIEEIKDVLFYILQKTYALSNHDHNKHDVIDDQLVINESSIKNLIDLRSGFEAKNPDIVFQFIIGIRNTSSVVREISHRCIEYLSELRGITKTELMFPYRNVITKRLLARALVQKDCLTLNSLLDGLAYILSIRPIVIDIKENLNPLVQIVLRKFDNFIENKGSIKIAKSAPCYFRFLESTLDLIEERKLIDEIVTLFIRGTFITGEISEISSKVLKSILIKYPDRFNDLFSLHFRSQIHSFLHDKTEPNLLNMIIVILSIGIIINSKDIVDKLSEIFKIRGDIILFKALEITSLLPPNLPDIFLNEIIDVAYFLEQRNKLLNNKRLKMIFKDMCEKNLGIIRFFIRRINDFCIYKIIVHLIKNSRIIKNNIREILIIDENLYSILLAKEIGVRFTHATCFTVIKVYQDLKNRNKDCNAIRNLIRTLELTGEYVNHIFEIDPEFVFNNPKQKFLLPNLNFLSRRKLIENIYAFNSKLKNTPIKINEIHELNDVDKQFYAILEGLFDAGIDMDLKGKIIMIFYRHKVKSSRIIYNCNLILQKGLALKHKAILYLSLVEPNVHYFEQIIYIHYEYKKYVDETVQILIDIFGPECFEAAILNILNDQLAYKNQLLIVYPMLICHSSLITYRITVELFDAICRLFSTMTVIHQATAIGLFERLNEKYSYVLTKENITPEEKNIATGLSIGYALFFSNACHAKDETQILKIDKIVVPMNFSFLFFVEDNLNYSLFSKAIDFELNKNINEPNSVKEEIITGADDEDQKQIPMTYKHKFIYTFNLYIKRCFNDSYIHTSFTSCVDAPFLLQCINKFFESSENPKTAAIVLMHILKLKGQDINIITNEGTLFEMFIRLVNILNISHQDLSQELIHKFIEVSPKINMNYNLIKFFESLLKNKSFTRSNRIIESSYFLLEDPEICLTDKISFINSFRFTDDLNLSFIIPFFKKECDLMPALQQTFIRGLQSKTKFLRDELFAILDDSISKGVFSRLRYLLNFDWCLYGGEWLYAFVRLCLPIFDDFTLETFIVCVIGDDSFYENIYHKKRNADKSKVKMQRLNVDMGEFIRNNIDGFVSRSMKYKGTEITELIIEILLYDYSLVVDFATELIFKMLLKLNEDEIRVIVEDIVIMAHKCDEKENISAFFKALSRLVDYYRYYAEEVNCIESGSSGSNIVSIIQEILSRPGFIKIVKRTNCFISFLNLVTDQNKREIYLVLKEEEFRLGLLKTRSKFPETLNALTCAQRGNYQQALDIFESLQMQAKKNELSFDEEEYDILEKEWIESAKKLQQWDILQDLGNSIGDCAMSTDASFRNCNFFSENEIGSVISVLNIRKNTCEKRFLDLFIEFMTNPDKITGNVSGKNLFNNKLEILKGDFITDIHSYPYSTKKSAECLTYLRCVDEMVKIPISFDLISDTEDVANWDLFTTFRIHLLNLLVRIDPIKKYFHEKAKVLYAFCKALRKNGMVEPSLYFLQKIFILPSIEAIDAYKKIMSEVKVYYLNEYYDNALEVLNSCNLNYFDNTKKANVFAWKARVYDKKGEFEEADRNILYSVQIESNIGKNWYTWGLFLDKRIDQIMEKICAPDSENKDGLSNHKMQLQNELDVCLENVFAAFLQSAIQTSGSRSRKSILRLLKYLRYENQGIINSFEAQKDEIDITRFFFFIPQLINLLDSNSHYCAKVILMQLIEKYPQSMFLPLRAKMSKKTRANIISENAHQYLDNDGFDATNNTSEDEGDKKDVNQIITNLFGASSYFLASTFFTLEGIVTDIIEKMNCTVEEDCYKITDAVFNESINMKFGDSSYSFNDINLLINRLIVVINQSQIRTEFKNELTSDFCGNVSLTLLDVAKISLKWKGIIENLLINMPILLNLAVIKTLNEYGSTYLSDIQIFGQYSEIRSVYEDYVLIEGFEPAHLTTWKNGNCIKKIIILGSDGKKYLFAFCDPVSDVYRREDRCIQLADFLDCDMKYTLKLKSYVNLSEKYRLVKLYEPHLFLDDIICYSNNRKAKPDFLIVKFLEYLVEIEERDFDQNNLNPVKQVEITNQVFLPNNCQYSYNIKSNRYNFTDKHKYEAYVRMIEEFGEYNIIKFFKEVYPNDEIYYFYKKEVIKNYTAQTIFFHLLSVCLRSPNRIAFGCENGRVYNLDIFPYFGEDFEYDALEKVPFRLTPNLQAFFTSEGIEGFFNVVSYTLCNDLKSNDAFKDLCLLFLEEEKYSIGNMFISKKYETIIQRMMIVTKDLTKLIKTSTNPSNLCLMSPLWHPWF